MSMLHEIALWLFAILLVGGVYCVGFLHGRTQAVTEIEERESRD